MKAYYFHCFKCGQWVWCTKKIKYKKCVHCGYNINFSKAEKEVYDIPNLRIGIEVMKKIKMRDVKEKDSEVKFKYD